MHRFLGYDMQNITHQYIAFFLDLGLLFMLIFVWKPLALCLIYLELWTRIVILSIVYLCKYLAVGSVRTMSHIDPTKHKTATHKLEEVFELPKYRNRKEWLRRQHNDLWDCITCVYSLSLFMRFLSTYGPSNATLRKHDRLARNSMLYRVFRHFI